MKEEDIDWIVYHHIPQQGTADPVDIAAKSGLDPDTVKASLWRLEKYFLVEITDGTVRLLSVGESLVRCQFACDADLPYTIENGIIKQKKTNNQ